ncbi:hypothetical protein JXM67_01580 [candidate division WOR-3 bacterium]|nr:hypothetical protein [candidate division WOR-3 bacterium]
MASIRGATFTAINSWINSSLSDNDYSELLRHMRAPVARTLTKSEVWTWYPLEYLTEIYECISTKMDLDLENMLDEIGNHLASADLSGGPKSKEARLPMPRVIPRLPSLWTRCRDCGELRVDIIDAGKREALLSLANYDGTPLHCKVNRAWIENVCALLAGKAIAVEEDHCRWEKGGNVCKWVVSWK